ncbi:RNA polymerase sigma factor [Pseudobacter ginsenosidimutans]|uniref:RNA polymerase sigma-70 factor (ECF subfamily) n=1 Tax=Pseudobacter ginsenosidimutans TaxID=661488 RepID=A0A4Q7N5F7_9BACT|nr:sigma-70 family RNA polymerase sigma factor [Pseudobacter ginsenosidimutans]QEC44794.1 sigma-70 family RNA polymerase sigma factor [Pseudobacter ginsenosidimutans]RZS76282.1 RNA polymerase sigma-70 factor (ECF subfamily) [Pseudobacter ginsenosidimutans]
MQENNTNRDFELFALIAEGDESAFEQLYNLYLPELYPVIFNIVKSELLVKDIIQELFLYLWMDREKLNGVDQPRNWIFKIAYNRSYSWLKKQIIRERAAQQMSTQEAENATEEAVHFSEASRLVLAAINELPPKSQQIYRLSREAGLKPAVIADQLGMDVQAVKNSLYRSGKALKAALASKGIIVPIALLLTRL